MLMSNTKKARDLFMLYAFDVKGSSVNREVKTDVRGCCPQITLKDINLLKIC